MTTNNFQVAEIQEKVESLENEEKSIQSQIDEVCLTFIVSVFKSLQFLYSPCSYWGFFLLRVQKSYVCKPKDFVRLSTLGGLD